MNRSINIVHKVYGDNAFITVRLNGLAQTTDRLAMREIARQLSFKGELDEGGDFVSCIYAQVGGLVLMYDWRY